MQFSKNSILANTDDMALVGNTFTVSGEDFFKGTQLVTTSAAVLNKGTITTPGMMVIKNLDASNYVELDNATFTIDAGAVRIMPGCYAMYRSVAAAPYICAKTASCRVAYLMIEA